MNYQQLLNEYKETTREILGRDSIPAAYLRNENTCLGKAEVHIDGLVYRATLMGGAFRLTGDYTY